MNREVFNSTQAEKKQHSGESGLGEIWEALDPCSHGLLFCRDNPTTLQMKVTGGLNASRLTTVLEDCLSKEGKFQPNLKCLAGRKGRNEISFLHRDKSASLLLQLNRHCGFHPETFALAVNLLDRFLTVVKANPKYLPCITISCMFLAAKMVEEDEAVPTAGALISVSGLSCTPSDLLRMERIILDKLEWNLTAVTPLQFLQVFHALCVSKGYLDNCPVTQHLHHVTVKLEELLCNHKFTFMKPSTLALALLSCEISFLTNNWIEATVTLQDMAEIHDSELTCCRADVLQYFNFLITSQCQKFMSAFPDESLFPHDSHIPPVCQIIQNNNKGILMTSNRVNMAYPPREPWKETF